jgi:hypothetical protein
MNRSIDRQGSLIACACAAALACPAPLHADTVHVRKTVVPVVAQTVTMNSVADVSYRTNCPMPVLSPDAEPAMGTILIGFEAGSALFPDECFQHFARAYRGVPLFATTDLPHQFKSATLVLAAQIAHNASFFTKPFASIFETSVATPLATFFAARRQVDPDSGRATVNSHAAATDGFDDGALQKLVTGPVQDKGSFNFRIDVTANVNSWLKDWPNRDKTPLRGFVFVSADENLFDVSNFAFSVSYLATLEFEIDDPDM